MDKKSRRSWRALAVAMLVVGFVFALATVLGQRNANEPSLGPVVAAKPPAETVTLRMRVVRLGGGTENFELLSSGRVLHQMDRESRELRLSPENVQRLERELLACGICTLEPADPMPAGPSRRRIDVAVMTQPQACSANLPWEKWFDDDAARNCLHAIETALQPLVDQCGECTIPQLGDASADGR